MTHGITHRLLVNLSFYQKHNSCDSLKSEALLGKLSQHGLTAGSRTGAEFVAYSPFEARVWIALFFGTICSQTFQAAILLAPAESHNITPLCFRVGHRCVLLEVGQSEGRWLSPLLAPVARLAWCWAGAQDRLMEDHFTWSTELETAADLTGNLQGGTGEFWMQQVFVIELLLTLICLQSWMKEVSPPWRRSSDCSSGVMACSQCW